MVKEGIADEIVFLRVVSTNENDWKRPVDVWIIGVGDTVDFFVHKRQLILIPETKVLVKA